ncbi:MAG TPA: PilZ domain-containing protein, partial [Thermoanaerobaculia bacterium]
MKRLVDLTVEDLEASPVWRYEGGTGAHATVAPTKRVSLSHADDEIFLAATEFQLADSGRHFGFCFPADDSGIDYLQPVIVLPARHVNFWFDGPAELAALSSQWKALGKEPREIFPVAYRCLVPVDGRTVSGRIDGVVSSADLTSGSPAPMILNELIATAVDQRSSTRVPTARPVQARRDTGPIEKRTARRHKADVKVEFSQGDLHGTGVIGNVSPRGMFVRSTRIPGTGPMLRLKVNLPEGRTLHLTGRVVRDSAAIQAPG